MVKCLPLLLLILGCAMPVDVRWVTTEEELRAHCGNDFLEEPAGCAKGGVMTQPQTPCTIYALGPPSFDEHRKVETLGHELLHCLTGRVHR